MDMIIVYGLIEILLLVGSGANSTRDLVAVIEAREYFKARAVEVNVERMTELAGKTSAKGKPAIAQLLAIRWLGEHPREVKNARGVRQLLEQVAAGKKGTDALGFAREYALRALARLDGKAMPPIGTLPDNSLRADALTWFPARSTFFGGVDLRPSRGATLTEAEPLRRLAAVLGRRGRMEIYDFADAVGNIRLDTLSFAVVHDPDADKQTRLYIRITGLASRKHLADYFRKGMSRGEIKEQKGSGGAPLTLIDPKGQGQGGALVGDTDFLWAGLLISLKPERDIPAWQEALQIRAGKKASIVKGRHARTLKTSPAQAIALLIGDIPERWRTALTGQRGFFRGLPQRFKLHCTRTVRGLEIRLQGAAATAREARAFVDSVAKLKKQAAEGLDLIPRHLKLDARTIAKVQDALNGVKVKAQDALLIGKVVFSREDIQALADLLKVTVWGQAAR